MEQSEKIEEEVLDKIAEILGVTPEAVKSFSEESVFNYFNNFSDHSVNQGPIGSHNTCNFNPLEKMVELFEENKKLYERLLASEREKVELLKNNKN